MQLLWLNMVTDTFPALALAMEPAEADVMRRPPRNPRDAILSARFLGGILLYGGFITGSALAAFLWALRAAPEQAVSAAFMTLALAQTLHLGNARSAEAVVRPRRVGANAYALGAVALSIGLQLAAMYVEPLSLVLRVQPLDAAAWAVVVGLSIVPAAAGQLLKLAGVRL
jgi:Ca2+-transporting ATPase